MGLKFVEKASTAIAAAVNAAGKSQSEREEPEAKWIEGPLDIQNRNMMLLYQYRNLSKLHKYFQYFIYILNASHYLN